MILLDHLTQSIRKAAGHNADVQAPPACILWPDKDRQWQAVIPQLQAVLPQLYVLGDYAPERRTGPSIWLRCVVAGLLPADTDPSLPDTVPVLYLPGFSRQDLRAVESCPEPIKLLAELQYRGVIWSQINAKDWTVLAYLKSDQGGLGLDVALDTETRHAMQLALARLLEEDVATLRGRHLDGDYFNGLLADDPVRSLLQWLDQGDTYRTALDPGTWQAFNRLSRSMFAFDPEQDGPLVGAARLAARQGPWRPVWDRFCEAPHLYPNLPDQIRKCTMPVADLFAGAAELGGWPQWNDTREDELRVDLTTLTSLPRHQAQQRVVDLEQRHGERRDLVWSTPLADALTHLAVIAKGQPLAGGSIADLAAAYQSGGWHVDAALLGALAAVTKQDDLAAVNAALTALYLPWVQEAARHFQDEVTRTGYPGGTIDKAPALTYPPGVCLLFVDGLRIDLAHRLIAKLRSTGHTVDSSMRWAALPSVTATAKPAVTPVRQQIVGQQANADFEPCVAASNKSLKGGVQLKKLLTDAGWQLLNDHDDGDPTGNAWCECGNIDTEGHDRGWKLARHTETLLDDIVTRLQRLLAAGWQTVHVVTDHGWLLFPGGLPKVDLHAALAENKWGRCAAIKEGAKTDAHLFPWYWNPTHEFALADGVGCFQANKEYAHGGLTLQECLTLELAVTSGRANAAHAPVVITEIAWRGLRCTVTIDGDPTGLSADLRTQPGNAAGSVAVGTKTFRDNGTVSLIVEDEDLEGAPVTVVVLAADGAPAAQSQTRIGGDV